MNKVRILLKLFMALIHEDFLSSQDLPLLMSKLLF